MKKFLLFAFSICLLNACSSDSEEDNIQKEDPPVAITLSAKSLTIDVKTKGPYILEEPTEATPLAARVISSTTAGDYTSFYSDGTMNFVGEGETPYAGGATNPYYPAVNSTFYFIGLYPASGWTDSPKTTAAFTFDGKTDVMYAGEPSTSKDAILAGGDAPDLTFKHMLTLLHVYIGAENANAQAAWGDITQIELVRVNGYAEEGDDASNTITVRIGEKEGEEENARMTFSSVPAEAGQKTPISFYIAEEETEEGTTTTTYSDTALSKYELTIPGEGETAPLVAYAMVESITASTNFDYTLKIYSENNEEGREVAINLMSDKDTAFPGSTQGKSFKITLTFGATDIKATATVTGWDPSGGADIDVK